MGISVAVLCIFLMTARCRESPLYGSGGAENGGAILHIHVAFDALERGTFVCVMDRHLGVCLHSIYCN